MISSQKENIEMSNEVLYPNKRLLNMKEFMNYTGLGESRGRKWAKEIGCMGKIGRRTVFDRVIIDEHIKELYKHQEA